MSRNENGSSGKEKKDEVIIKKDEVIEVLKTLEGLKRKLLAFLKT
jgi:hypothetical protein